MNTVLQISACPVYTYIYTELLG